MFGRLFERKKKLSMTHWRKKTFKGKLSEIVILLIAAISYMQLRLNYYKLLLRLPCDVFQLTRHPQQHVFVSCHDISCHVSNER